MVLLGGLAASSLTTSYIMDEPLVLMGFPQSFNRELRLVLAEEQRDDFVELLTGGV